MDNLNGRNAHTTFLPFGSGAGSALPYPILLTSGLCTLVSVFVSAMSIFLHLKNYRQPMLQRMVIRIMLMVPIYGISSLISLFSMEAAFVIDAIRDIYEAFVIYCFFSLLLGYLGGERSLLILLHGREPKQSVFPASLFKRELDVSDPYMFLFLKRGILQYVQVKPVLAVATLILKAVGKYNDGDLTANSGYLYISVIYNISICLSLYCLAMFWMCVNEDLKPFRPMPKFLCVKGILFFSFWQSIFISILVAAGAIKHLGNTTDREHISVGLIDTLICFEMPIFAVAHMYAFAHTDYINTNIMYAARMPMYYALRDAFGLKDVIEDTKATLRGEGMDYREFEPAEGFIHQGSGRDRRIKAGLRYAQGGQKKYWLPMPADATESRGHRADVVHNVTQRAAGSDDEDEVYAPLLENQIADIVHDAPDMRSPVQEKSISERRGFELPFGDPDEEEETLYVHSKNYVFGDYHYPCIDASSEYARKQMWDEEERVLRDERGAFFSPIRQHVRGYGAVQAPGASNASTANTLGKGKARDGAEQVYVGTPRMIDRGADNIPDAGGDGLRLNWTKYDEPNTKTNIRPSSPHLSPQLRQVNISSVGASSPRASSSLSSSPRTHTLPHAQVRTDAVDLVVENESVAEAETVKERMRGEPAVRGSAWRKAYTRGYFHPEMKGEVADDEEEDTTAGDNGRKDVTLQAETRRSDEIVPDQRLADNSHPVETIIEEAGLEVARAATPPPHAQVGGIGQHSNMGGLHSHDYTINDENPWA